MRNLIFILGDQLDLDAPVFRDFDKARDVIVMAEVAGEAHRYPNHKQRLVLFFAAMRHFREQLKSRGFEMYYQQIDDDDSADSLPKFLQAQIAAHKPARIIMTEAGRYDLEQELTDVAADAGLQLEWREDTHFFCSRSTFKSWAAGRKSLVMEYFYRTMRKEYGYLMAGNKPIGDTWNFDKENRGSFGKAGNLLVFLQIP